MLRHFEDEAENWLRLHRRMMLQRVTSKALKRFACFEGAGQ
jgi:hypothetical protein